MSNSQMFVPAKIKVGYQKREDTYTKRLAYVIYFDNKGVLRKEKSWEGWRDKKIAAKEFTNEPLSGFVLNRGVGGVRGSWSSNARNEYIRVYDPRDFEFEISVANLLFILQESSSIKGKGLEGEFVYAWEGTELVLLPVDSAEYGLCTEHTARQSKKIGAKDVKAGFTYRMKNGTNVLYLGKYPYSTTNSWTGFTPIGNRHIFLDLDQNGDLEFNSPYIVDSGFTRLAEAVSPAALPTFPDELDKFKASKWYGEIVGYSLREMIPDEEHIMGKFLVSEDGSKYHVIHIRRSWNYLGSTSGYSIQKSAAFVPEMKDNKVEVPSIANCEKRSIGWDELKKFKFYKLKVKTPAGTGIDIRI
ncbi:hypothetical protein M0R72_00625 [Candidatus Pacearchaeota archaeon]|nr:hypothetical protein [Candidatus Pacearchaeota archaeon]